MDNTDDFNGFICGVCYEEYNLEDHLPRLLPQNCGHTLCSNCIKKILSHLLPQMPFKCPFDKTEFHAQEKSLDLFPVNFGLKALIEKRASKPSCQEHHKPLNYVCLTHDVRLCTECVISGNHKNSREHNKHAFKKIKSLLIERRDHLKNIQTEICSFNPEMECLKKLVENQREKSKAAIHGCFQKGYDYLKQEEEKQLSNVNNFFDKQIQEIEKENEKYKELKKEIEEEIGWFQRLNPVKGFVELFEKDISQFSIKLETFKINFLQSSYKKFFKNFLDQLTNSLESQLSEISSLKFDISSTITKLSASAKMWSFEQVQALLLQDFDIVFKTLGLPGECGNKICSVEEVLNPVSGSIEAIKSLSRICISLHDPRIFTPEIKMQLQKVRVFLKNIHDLCLNLNYSPDPKICEQDAHDLLQILFWNPLSLTSLYLHLNTSALTDSTLEFLANQIFPKTLNLQNISTDFEKINTTPQSFKILFRSLEPISENLISLELDFSKLCPPLTENFPCFDFLLPNLKRFRGNFCNTSLDDNSFDGFLKKTLPSLTEIEMFHINLRNTRISDQVILKILKTISNGFGKCKQLAFGLEARQAIVVQENKYINRILENLKKLEHISFLGPDDKIRSRLNAPTWPGLKQIARSVHFPYFSLSLPE